MFILHNQQPLNGVLFRLSIITKLLLFKHSIDKFMWVIKEAVNAFRLHFFLSITSLISPKFTNFSL
jgi:hypothetical protein